MAWYGAAYNGVEDTLIRIHCPVLDVFAASSWKSWLGWWSTMWRVFGSNGEAQIALFLLDKGHDDNMFDARTIRTFWTVLNCYEQQLTNVDNLARFIDNLSILKMFRLSGLFFGGLINLLFFMNSFVVQHKSQWDSEERSYQGALHYLQNSHQRI